MKKILFAVFLIMTITVPAVARDIAYMVPLADVLALPEAGEKLDGSVKFFLKGQALPEVEQRLGVDSSTRKTNVITRGDVGGCKWAALSALMAFQDKAKAQGANAVVDIVSYYKKKTVANAVEFECHAGAFVVGVALKGTYAKIAH